MLQIVAKVKCVTNSCMIDKCDK